MKKIFIYFVTILSLFAFVGCGNKKTEKTTKNIKKEIGKGRMYEFEYLFDGKVKVFNALIPSDWKATIESRWDIVNSDYPGLEEIYISSPDHKATIKIISQQSYTQNNKFKEGINKDYYTTYLHYMNASTYLDYYMNQNNKGAKLAKELPTDEKFNQQIKDFNNIIVSNQQEVAKQINAGGQVSVSYNSYATSTSKKQYTYGNNYIEATTAVAASKSSLRSKYSNLLNSDSIVWIMPYTIIYTGEDKESFDKYYDDYLFIIANSSFTVNYYALIEYVSSAIINAYTTIYTEKSKAGLEAWNNYVDSNYSSTSSVSTNEKVMEMWDDVIKEVDSYKLEDGTTLKTSIHNDVVAQKGDEIYIGNKAGIPTGFNQLSKSY